MSDTRTPAPVRPAAEPNGELLHRVQQIRLDNQLGARKSGGGGASWLPWVLCLLLALSWAGVGVRWYHTAPRDESPAAAGSGNSSGSASAASGGSSPSASDSDAVPAPVKGYLVPARQIAVSPIDVAGQIVELNVVEGQVYKEGEVLARIDPSSFRAAYDESVASHASAQKKLLAAEQRLAELMPDANPPAGSVRYLEIQQIKAQLAEAQAQEARARDDRDRVVKLGGGTSERERVQAENDLLAAVAHTNKLKADLSLQLEGPRPEKLAGARADVETARAEVKAAQARVVQAKWRLDNCTIKAPITGMVLTKKAEKWNLVNPLAFAATSGSVCDMADLSDLEADLKIPEREIARLKVGQPCRVKADAYPDKVYVGVLDRIMPIANRSDNTVNVRVKVKLPPGEVPGTYLKPEMGAVVTFLPTAEKK